MFIAVFMTCVFSKHKPRTINLDVLHEAKENTIGVYYQHLNLERYDKIKTTTKK